MSKRWTVAALAIIGALYLGSKTRQQKPVIEENTSQSTIVEKGKQKSDFSRQVSGHVEQASTAKPEKSAASMVADQSRDLNQRSEIPVQLDTVMKDDPAHFAMLEKFHINIQGRDLTLSRGSFKSRGANNATWIGTVDGYPHSEVVMTYVHGYVAAHFQMNGGAYTLDYEPHQKTYILSKIDKINFGDDTVAAAPEAGGASGEANASGLTVTAKAQTSGAVAAAASSATVVDAVFAMSNNTWTTTSDQDAVKARIYNGVELTNQVYVRSGVNAQIQVLSIGLANYNDTGDLQKDIYNVAKQQQLVALRNKYGADFYSLVVAKHGYIIGVSFMPGGSATNGASVFASDWINTMMTGHEYGHAFGLAHEVNAATTNTPPKYVYGRPNQFDGVHTVMFHEINSKTIQYFSNPAVTYDGYPTGIANQYEEARATNNMVATIAKYKTRLLPPDDGDSAPTDPAPTGVAPTIKSLSGAQSLRVGGSFQLQVQADGTAPFTYQWQKDGVKLADGSHVSGSAAASLSISQAVAADGGGYQVLVTNSYGSVLSQKVNVSVSQNVAPIANAGKDISVVEGTTVTLDGSGSSDADGDALAYSWAQLSGPANVSLSSASAAKVNFVASVAGAYVFQLSVSDGQATTQASVNVTVTRVAQNSDIKIVSGIGFQYGTLMIRSLSVQADVGVLAQISSVSYQVYEDGHLKTALSATGAQFQVNYIARKASQYSFKATIHMQDGSTMEANGDVH